MKNKLIYSKNGAAIEIAVFFMVIVFTLCTIITTTSITVRSKDHEMVQRSNEDYVVDQIGEYFVRGITGNSSIDFKKDIKDEKTDIRGGWVKFMGNDTLTYGININTEENPTKTTMRLARWNHINADGTLKNTCKPILILTVQAKSDGWKIINWSDQTVEYSVKDASPASDTTEFENFVKAIVKFVQLVVGIVTTVISVITDIFGNIFR